jgi:hypothetical protein
MTLMIPNFFNPTMETLQVEQQQQQPLLQIRANLKFYLTLNLMQASKKKRTAQVP